MQNPLLAPSGCEWKLLQRCWTRWPGVGADFGVVWDSPWLLWDFGSRSCSIPLWIMLAQQLLWPCFSFFKIHERGKGCQRTCLPVRNPSVLCPASLVVFGIISPPVNRKIKQKNCTVSSCAWRLIIVITWEWALFFLLFQIPRGFKHLTLFVGCVLSTERKIPAGFAPPSFPSGELCLARRHSRR